MAILELLGNYFMIPICGKASFKQESRACLRFHMGKCFGPCQHKAPEGLYSKQIKEVIKFLDGASDKLLSKLKREMERCALDQQYERAAQLHCQYRKMAQLGRRYLRLCYFPPDQESVVFFRAYGEAGYSAYYIAEGQVKGQIDCSLGWTVDQRQSSLEGFVSHICHKRTMPAPHWLSEALREVYGDKRMVLLPKNRNRQGISRSVIAEAETFANYCRQKDQGF